MDRYIYNRNSEKSEFAEMTEANRKRDYLTTTQAAEVLSVSPDTVLKWVKAGKLKAHRTLGGHFRIPLQELEQLAGSAAIPLATRPPAAHQYCWEFLASGDEVKAECRECITYRSRSKRCYELRDLPDGLGCLRLGCQSSCEDCQYYQLVHGEGVKVLVLTENRKPLLETLDSDNSFGLEVRYADSEYECGQVIESFRPDYIVVDCSIGRRRTAEVCDHIYDDPRIPVPRIILASKTKNIKDYCDREVFAWIRKPFSAEQLRECVEGVTVVKN